MSVEKSESRAAMAHDLGVRFDDALEASEREALRLEGASEWLVRASPLVAAAHKALEAEVDAGKLDLEAAAAAKTVVTRLAGQLAQLAQQAAGEAQAARGKAAAFRAAVGLTKQAHDAEKAKAKAAALAEEPLARVVGTRPPPPIKARRKAGKRAKDA